MRDVEEFLRANTDPARPRITGRTILVFAHPDDETLACGALLPRLDDVLIVHVTDGAPRNGDDARRRGFDTPADYAAARRRELAAAVALAGLAEERLLSLDVADQGAAFALADIARRLALLLENADLVITHAYEGGHPDHDAAAFGVHMAGRILGDVLTIVEMPLYRLERSERIAQRFRPDLACPELTLWLDEEQRKLKRDMLDAHESQRSVTGPFRIDVERFRRAPTYDFSRPPNDGEILYDQFGWDMTGARWQELARDALAELGFSP
jgi:N-acetylglucosamine malate deacetylase 2